MPTLYATPGAPPESFSVISAKSARGLDRDRTRRFMFSVPQRWRSPVSQNPFAAEAERRVMQWFEALGCTCAEVERARKFDAAGYVGIPFPSLSPDRTVRIAKYLSLWLLWDDVQVETLDGRWRIDPVDVVSGRRPEVMTRFDEGWWELLQELAASRSPAWIDNLCKAMTTWDAAAVDEAVMMQEHRERGTLPTFAEQMELRIATIGMYATVYLLEDAYDFELPRAFHASPLVLRLKVLANKIVGLGNDILSFGKDYTENQINLTTTLMRERGLTVDAALEHLVRMHDDALDEYDTLADAVGFFSTEADPFIARWLQDVRYAALGFSLWESQAPRYTAYKVVAAGRLIEPGFSFFPPPGSVRAARLSSLRPGPPSSHASPAPQEST
jgi:hypothetical protein